MIFHLHTHEGVILALACLALSLTLLGVAFIQISVDGSRAVQKEERLEDVDEPARNEDDEQDERDDSSIQSIKSVETTDMVKFLANESAECETSTKEESGVLDAAQQTHDNDDGASVTSIGTQIDSCADVEPNVPAPTEAQVCKRCTFENQKGAFVCDACQACLGKRVSLRKKSKM
jgi:hypothetical protein